MNGFEKYTLIIGCLAVIFEAIKHIKDKVKNWGHH